MYKKLFLIIGILTLAFGYMASLWIDPDFGWHYRLGQIISGSGIPKTDPFSFTMPSYLFVDYEWLTNVLYFRTYELLGYQWLAGVHAVAAIAAALIALSSAKAKTKYLFIPFFLILASFAGRFGVRPQVFSWLFLGIFIKIFYDKERWNKLRWFFPPLMLIWANFHGSFPLAIGLSAVLIFLKSYNARRVIYSDFVVLFMGIAATFINPYGAKNWEEVVNQMKLTGLYRQSVAEWRSIIFSFDMGFIALYVFTFVIAWANRKKLELWEIVMLTSGFWAGISSGRHAPLSVILIAPLFVKYFLLFEVRAKKIPLGQKRLNMFYNILLIVSAAILISQVWSANRSLSKFNEKDFYPSKAAAFLKDYSSESKKIFADYAIGGYLIWKLPNNKYFIDGRMPGFVYSDAPKGESGNAYEEYLNIMCGRSELSASLDNYNVDIIIARNSSETAKKTTLAYYLEDIFVKAGLVYCKSGYSFAKEVNSLGWPIIYQDNAYSVYVRE